MPLKIIHHRESSQNQKKNDFDINIAETLQKLCFLCDKLVSFSYLIFNNLEVDKCLQEKNLDIMQNKIDNINEYLKSFEVIFGKKFSIMESISKATILMQKIQALSDKFGISLTVEDCNKNEEYLTDDDIDMMVQMVKDFGPDRIREDARYSREELENERILKEQNNNKELDVYDIYHNDTYEKEYENYYDETPYEINGDVELNE